MFNFMGPVLVSLMVLVLGGCAAPGSQTKIPTAAAVALAGGDVSDLPPEAWTGPPIEIDLRWYDRTIGVQVDRDESGAHFFDLTSAASGENALEARRSDNARAVSALDILSSTFLAGAGMAAGRPAGALGAPQPAPPAAAAPAAAPLPELGTALPVVDHLSPEAINRALAEIVIRLGELEGRGESTPPAANDIETPESDPATDGGD